MTKEGILFSAIEILKTIRFFIFELFVFLFAIYTEAIEEGERESFLFVFVYLLQNEIKTSSEFRM